MDLSRLTEIFIEFLDDKDSSPHTIRNYKGTLNDFTRYIEEEIFNGIAMLDNITIEHLQEYMSYRKEKEILAKPVLMCLLHCVHSGISWLNVDLRRLTLQTSLTISIYRKKNAFILL